MKRNVEFFKNCGVLRICVYNKDSLTMFNIWIGKFPLKEEEKNSLELFESSPKDDRQILEQVDSNWSRYLLKRRRRDFSGNDEGEFWKAVNRELFRLGKRLASPSYVIRSPYISFLGLRVTSQMGLFPPFPSSTIKFSYPHHRKPLAAISR